MKGSCTLVASALAAASTAAMASSSSRNRDVTSNPCTNQGKSVNSKEKYAPRFDGLRFIETLITAHR